MRVHTIFFLVFSFSAFSFGAISLYDEYGSPFGTGKAYGGSEIGTPVELNIFSDDISDWTGYLVVDYYPYDDGLLTNPQTFYEAGGNGTNNTFSQSGIGQGYQFISETKATTYDGIGGPFTLYERPSAGIQHSADFIFDDIGLYYLSLYDERLDIRDPIDYLKVYVGSAPGIWAWSVIDGTYSIDVGETIRLSGRHSWGGDAFRWSIDGNVIGYFNEMQEVSYDTLVNTFGLTPGSTYQVELYTATLDVEDYAYTDLTIIPEPASMSLILFGSLFVIRKKRISVV